MTLRERFLARTDGDALEAACLLAEGLMEGDPVSFKAGYTRPNATIAASEMFGLDRDAIDSRLTERGLS